MLIGGSATLSMVHAGARLVDYAFPVVAFAMALRLLIRHRCAAYVEFVLWLWLFEPEIRRMVDYKSSYHRLSPVMVAAPLCGLIGLLYSRRHRSLAYKDSLVLFGLMGLVLAYGFLIGAMHGLVTGAAADILQYGAPVGLGYYMLSAPDRDDMLRRNVRNVALWGCLLVGLYGLAQFLVLPHWDAYWMVQSGISTAGKPYPLQVRVFSTLDTAGPLGETLIALIALCLGDLRGSRVLRYAAVGAGTISLGLSQARSAWISLAFAFVLLIVVGRIKIGRTFVFFLFAVGLLAAVGGPVYSTISSRFSNSVSAGSSDTSFSARLAFQSTIAPTAIKDVVGQGLGSTGTSTKLASSNTSSATASAPGYLNKLAISASDQALVKNFDSGIFEILFAFGSIPGLAVLSVATWASARAWKRARQHDRFDAYVAAILAGLVLSLIFTDTLKSVDGAWTWALFGLVGRSYSPVAQAAPASTAPAGMPA